MKLHHSTRVHLTLVVGIVCFAAAAAGLASVVSIAPPGVPQQRRQEYHDHVDMLRRTSDPAWSARRAEQPQVQMLGSGAVQMGMRCDDVPWQTVVEFRNNGKSELTVQWLDQPTDDVSVEPSQLHMNAGQVGQVRIRGIWTSDSPDKISVHFRTNDPKARHQLVRILSRSPRPLYAERDRLEFGRVDPDEIKHKEIGLFSETIDLSGWLLAPMNSPPFSMELVSQVPVEDLPPKARSGCLVRVACGGFGGKQSIDQPIEFSFQPDDSIGDESTDPNRPVALSLPARASLRSRIRVTGNVSALKGLEIGDVVQGTRVTRKLVLQVRGEQLPSELRVRKTKPAFVEADIRPTENPRQYDLHIAIPETAPQAFMAGHQFGMVVIGSDLLPTDLRIPVHFNVFADASLAPNAAQ
ncbi:MAG: hypothetical protein AAGJ40_18385 [Planctomycetota bacterium]